MASAPGDADRSAPTVRPPRGRRALRREYERLRQELATSTVQVEQLRSELDILRQQSSVLADRLAAAEELAKSTGAKATEWSDYAAALGATAAGLQAWVDWYAESLAAAEEESGKAAREVARLRAESADREMLLAELVARQAALAGEPRPEPVVAEPGPEPVPAPPPAPAASAGVEAVLREQIVDLRARLDHAAELVDHVVRRLVTHSAPPPPAPVGTRLHLPLESSTFDGPEAMTPIDLDEDYPWVRERPTA